MGSFQIFQKVGAWFSHSANLILLVSLLLLPLDTNQVDSRAAGASADLLPSGRTFYVTPGGSPKGNGSAAQPWNLSFVLKQPAALKPGDTVLVRGGRYVGSFRAHMNGKPSSHITIRAYPGERVVMTNSNDFVLEILDTHYVDFWGLEIAGSQAVRTAKDESAYGVLVYQGKKNTSSNIRFINMIIHDMQGSGFGWWQSLSDSEIYGSLIYYNGTNYQDHGLYIHNNQGTKALVNNFIFDNSGHGVHAYSQTDDEGLNNIYLVGNTIFDNGSIRKTLSRNILVGGWIPAKQPVITNNYVYFPGKGGQTLNLGLEGGSKNAEVKDNYLAGGEFEISGPTSGLDMKNNVVYAPNGFKGFNRDSYPDNDWKNTPPTGISIKLRKNEFDANRANLTIYNWDGQKSVLVKADKLGSLGLKAGDHYSLHNVQNYFTDVVSGVYNGSSIRVPMTGHTVAQPRGITGKPGSTFPEFGAFVMIVKR